MQNVIENYGNKFIILDIMLKVSKSIVKCYKVTYHTLSS